MSPDDGPAESAPGGETPGSDGPAPAGRAGAEGAPAQPAQPPRDGPTGGPGEVELYTYHRVDPARADELAAALDAAHRALLAEHPGLRLRRLRRTDADPAGAAAPATWMEVWQRPGSGIDPALADALEARLAPIHARHGGLGLRHVERFVARSAPADPPAPCA